MQKVTFKPLKSFTPLIAYAAPYNGIVVKNDAPWKTFKELIEYAKKNPNKVKYGTGGIGTAMHHAMAFVEHQDGIKWIHVPYKGNADALTALLGGHVDVASVGPEWVPFVKSGTMRILAVTEEKRNPNLRTCQRSRISAMTLRMRLYSVSWDLQVCPRTSPRSLKPLLQKPRKVKR